MIKTNNAEYYLTSEMISLYRQKPESISDANRCRLHKWMRGCLDERELTIMTMHLLGSSVRDISKSVPYDIQKNRHKSLTGLSKSGIDKIIKQIKQKIIDCSDEISSIRL